MPGIPARLPALSVALRGGWRVPLAFVALLVCGASPGNIADPRWREVGYARSRAALCCAENSHGRLKLFHPSIRAGQPGLFSGLQPRRKGGNSGPFPGHCSLVLFSRSCSVTHFSKMHALGGRVKFDVRPADAGLSLDILATPAVGRCSPSRLYSQLCEPSVCIS